MMLVRSLLMIAKGARAGALFVELPFMVIFLVTLTLHSPSKRAARKRDRVAVYAPSYRGHTGHSGPSRRKRKRRPRSTRREKRPKTGRAKASRSFSRLRLVGGPRSKRRKAARQGPNSESQNSAVVEVANRNVDGVRPRLHYQNVRLVGPDAVRESGMPCLLKVCN